MQEIARQCKDGVTLAVHVVPRSARSEVVGVRGPAVRVRLKAPPVGGAANAALITLLAKALGVPSYAVEIISGHTSRRKVLSVAGLSIEDAQRWLESLPADD
jgi:uncharacterized protein (TIGR00251 family)